MGIWLELADSQTAVTLLQQAESMFRHAEGLLSRFDPASELSQINARQGFWIPVSDMMWSVVTQALFMARETEGLFDPTLLTALEAAGYDRSFEQLVVADVMAGMMMVGDQSEQWQKVKLVIGGQSLWLPPGVKLDLGGIAKGYTAQQVVDFLTGWGPCLVDAGGDLTAGLAPTGWPGWPVAVASPLNKVNEPRAELLPIWLVEGSMATSGIDYRRWQYKGHSAHHLIDPRTGQPAETDLLTATVLAKTAVRAEAWATAALVAGTTSALQKLTNTGLAAALVDRQNKLLFTPALTPFLGAETQQIYMR